MTNIEESRSALPRSTAVGQTFGKSANTSVHPSLAYQRVRPASLRQIDPGDTMVLQRTIGNQAEGRTTSQTRVEQQTLEKRLVAANSETSLPNNLRSGVESMSGLDMSAVRVHRNSDKPAQIGALAYTQGGDIHLAPGQEQYLPHEAWHVVQQAQGRVKPTMQMKDGVPVNDDHSLEHEADVMGAKAMRPASATGPTPVISPIDDSPAVLAQRRRLGSLFGSAIQPHSLKSEFAEEERQPAQRAAAREESRTVVQRVEVQGPSSVSAPVQPIQAVTIKRLQNPGVKSSFGSSAVDAIIDEVGGIVAAAERARGERFYEGHDLERLEGLLNVKGVKAAFPTSANETFGLGGSSYFQDVTFTTVQGSRKFYSAVEEQVEGPIESLGKRKAGTHDEIHHINAYPGLQSLLSTQGHCLFCYGLIHKRGYEHGAIRDNPWPTMWKHDYMGFTLREIGDFSLRSGVFSNDLIIEINSTVFGSRRYRITNE